MEAECNPTVSEGITRIETLLKQSDMRIFLPTDQNSGGLFRKVQGGTELVEKVDRARIDQLHARGVLRLIASTENGRHYKPILCGEGQALPGTARDRKNAAWLAAERVFKEPDGKARKIRVSLGESPLGWLSRRRDPQGRPFLSKDEVAAGERLRADFEQSQLAPSVTFDWRRMLTSAVDGGVRSSAQERDIGGGATAARERLHEALESLGPGLADVAVRACCFLEGLETVESSMNWSARSGKIVLRIALQRLATFYEQRSVRSNAKIEVWSASDY